MLARGLQYDYVPTECWYGDCSMIMCLPNIGTGTTVWLCACRMLVRGLQYDYVPTEYWHGDCSMIICLPNVGTGSAVWLCTYRMLVRGLQYDYVPTEYWYWDSSMITSLPNIGTGTAVWLCASWMLVRGVLYDFVPTECWFGDSAWVNKMVARSKAWVCDRSLAGIAGSNPIDGECLCLLNVVCCQAEASATGWSLLQRIPAECDVSDYVRGTSTRGSGPTWGLLSRNKSLEACRASNTFRNYGEFCCKKLIVRNQLLKPDVDVRMILKWIVKMEDGSLQSGFF